MDRVRGVELVDGDLAEAQARGLAGRGDLRQRGPGLLKRCVGGDAVQLVEVDVVDAEALQRSVDRLAQVLG